MDLVATAVGLIVASIVIAAFGLRGRSVSYARVARHGGSALLDTRTMNMAYWALEPVVRTCVRFGISANAVTFASLALGLTAGVLLAFGHFGVAALASAAAALGDAVDGLVASEMKTASAAGEILDAAVDRYCETFFLGGLAVHYGAVWWALVLTLAALLGAFMVSYSTAKAEALGVPAPRGTMRRAERATYLTCGAVLVPITMVLAPGFSWWVGELPILGALALVAIIGNVSAVRRLMAVARAAMRSRRFDA